MKWLAFYFTVTTWAQSALEPPRLGMMLDPAGTVRPVSGVSGSVALGGPVASGVLSVACSRELCLVKTRTSIISSGQHTKAPLGPAIFALAGNTALIYFPLVRECARWQDGRIEPVALAVTGDVLSLRVRDNGNLEFAVRRNHGTWIVNARDETIDSIPADTGPVMLLADGVIYVSLTEVILRRSDASEIRFSIDEVDSLSALGEEYIQVRTRRTSYAIHTARGRERMFLLPEPAP